MKDYYSPSHAAKAKPQDHAVGAAAAKEPRIIQDPSRLIARGKPWFALILLPIYFVSMFLATFFNVAFYNEIIAALNGKGVSFARGLAWPAADCRRFSPGR